MNIDYTPDDDRKLAEWLNIHGPCEPGHECYHERANYYLTEPNAETDYRVLEAVRSDMRRMADFGLHFKCMSFNFLREYQIGDYARAAYAVMTATP